MRPLGPTFRRQLCVAALLLMTTACGKLDLRLHKATVDEGKVMAVTARLSGAEEGTEVKFKVTQGQECGRLSSPSANIVAGIATV